MNLFTAIFAHEATLPAISHSRREITYGQLRSETLRMAQLLCKLGAKPGDRVALLLHDSPEFVELFIAAVSLGAIAVPINTALRLEEQHSIILNSRARFGFVERDLCSPLLTGAEEKLRSLEEVVLVERPESENNPIDNEGTARIHSLQALLENAAEFDDSSFPDPRPDQAALILYTSGSTGEPKGAVHRQADIFYTN